MVARPPFPLSGSYLKAVRESTKMLRIDAKIKISPEAIKRVLYSAAFTSSFSRVSQNHGLKFPLKFDSHLDQLNFISVLSILNFASGYRVPLHQQLNRGAWDTIRAFVFSLYIMSSTGENLLSSNGMKSIDITKVAELMGISLHIERPHEALPGVTVGELGGPLYDLVSSVTRVLNETGEILVAGNYQNLGRFVLEALQEGSKYQNRESDLDALEIVLERLVKAFPAFQDMAIVNGHSVYCFKKALFLIHAIHIHFGAISPPPFFVPSTKNIPIFADNVIPSMLIHLGILDLSEALSGLKASFPSVNSQAHLADLLGLAPDGKSTVAGISPQDNGSKAPKEGPVLSNDQAFIVRAAAIDACEMMIDQARLISASEQEGSGQDDLTWTREITLPELDIWLWSVAKDRSDYRALERFVQRDTVFY